MRGREIEKKVFHIYDSNGVYDKKKLLCPLFHITCILPKKKIFNQESEYFDLYLKPYDRKKHII